MADVETIHRVVEALEVKGGDAAAAAFEKIAKTSDHAAKAMGQSKGSADQLSFGFDKVDEASGKVGDSVEKSGKKSKNWMDKAGSSVKKWASGMMGAVTVGNLLAKAIEFAVRKLAEFVRVGWAINEAYEAAQGRVQGLAMGLTQFDEGADALERVETSARVTNKVMGKFRTMALDAALPLSEIEGAYARIDSVVSGLGRSQTEILDFTRKSAAAAKIYGENAEMAGGIVSKAIFQGVVEGETAFATAFKAQAQVTSKMPVEERIKRITKTLEAMGAPLGVVTKDTASAFERWKVLSLDVLQRVTVPAYQKIGQIVQSIVDYFRENEDAIDAVTIAAEEVWHTIFNWLDGIWESAVALDEVLGSTDRLASMFAEIGRYLEVIWRTIDIAGAGLKLAAEQVRVLADPDRGMGKLVAFSEAINLKWHEIAKSIMGVVRSMTEMVVPDWVVEKVPGVKGFFEGMENVAKGIDLEIESTGKRLRAIEKNLGTGALTQTTRAMKRLEEGSIDLSKIKGRVNVTQQIGKVEIHQDFKDQDPDRVLIEFVSGLERIGETALQSNSGGFATAFETGGSSF